EESAAEASMLFTVACACGERTNTAQVWPGRVMSSVYWPLPVMKRWSSLRLTGAPMPVAVTGVLLLVSMPPRGFLPADWSFGVEGRLGCPGRGSAGGPRGERSALFRGLPHAAGHGRGARFHGGDDVVVARAAAQVALEPLADGVLVEVAALPLHQVDGGHDHAGGAEAALQGMVLPERLLHGMQRP